MNKREKEVIKKLENLLIEVEGASNHDESRLCTLHTALFSLRRGDLDATERDIKLMQFNDAKRNQTGEQVQQPDYWKVRCLMAEDYIEKSPCDPDVRSDQWAAYKVWQDKIAEGESK